MRSTRLNFRITVMLGIAACAMPTYPRLPSAASVTVYLSATGDDRNSGSTVATAFKTPERVLAELRRRPGPAMVYIAGTFRLDAPIRIDKTLSGSIWTSGTGATLLAANGNSSGIVIDGAHDVTVTKLTLRGFTDSAILVEGGRRTVLSGNKVYDTRSTQWSQAAIHLRGATAGSVVTGNLVSGSDYAGILVDTYGAADVSGTRIAGNIVLNTCRKVRDCGAIYVNDRPRRSTGVIIEDNVVRDFGPPKTHGRGIYLDDWASNVMVRRNVISGPGAYAFQIHGGSNNLITGNKVDMNGIGTFLLYQRFSNTPDGTMRGNRVIANAITASATPVISTSPADLRSEGAPLIRGNLFCAAGKRCARP